MRLVRNRFNGQRNVPLGDGEVMPLMAAASGIMTEEQYKKAKQDHYFNFLMRKGHILITKVFDPKPKKEVIDATVEEPTLKKHGGPKNKKE